MNQLENSQTLEQVESNLENDEMGFAYSTQIKGFEQSGLFNNQEVADYLKGLIPFTHLQACQELVYQAENFVPGLGELDLVKRLHQVVGERVYDRLGAEFGLDKDEFAHQYAEYILNEEGLRLTRNELYEKFRLDVFDGKEFNGDWKLYISNEANWRSFERLCEGMMQEVLPDDKWKVEVQRKQTYNGETKIFDIHIAERRRGGYSFVFDAKHFQKSTLNKNEIDTTLEYKTLSHASKAVILYSSSTEIPDHVRDYADEKGVALIQISDRPDAVETLKSDLSDAIEVLDL